MTALGILGTWWTTTMLPWAIDSTIVGLLLLAVARLARPATPAFRKGLVTVALVKMVVPPLLLPVGLLSFGVTDPTGTGPAPLGSPLAGPAIGLLGGLHLLGVALGAGMLARRVWHLHHLRATARKVVTPAVGGLMSELASELGWHQPPDVLESDLADVPFVTGLIRPIVVLPSGLLASTSPEQLRGLLAHELLHLRNLDLWFGWLRAIALLIWWPSPVARALGRIQESAAEELCDDLVVGRGFASTADYARGLVAAAANVWQDRRAPVAAAVGVSDLEHRILRFGSPSRARLGRWSAFGLIALSLFLLPPSSTGRVSSAGWTTRVLFAHGAPATASGPPPSDHGHQHGH